MEAKESKFNIAETVKVIRKAREELQTALEAERRACRPILTDRSLVDKILAEFRHLRGDKEMTRSDRQTFIFIIQYLYAPRSLFGVRMPPGLRSAIARSLHLHTHSIISNVSNNNLFNYHVYSQFRNDCNHTLDEIVKWLIEHQIIHHQ